MNNLLNKNEDLNIEIHGESIQDDSVLIGECKGHADSADNKYLNYFKT